MSDKDFTVMVTGGAGYIGSHAVLALLDTVDRLTNRWIERKLEARRPGDPGELVADNERILATQPWRPKRDDLATIVADALAWERKRAERG